MKQITLNDGHTLPPLGFGTAAIGKWQQDDDYVKNVVLSAIKEGYRHIDTASVYGNERSVGRAIKESGVPREEFFITTKVWETEQGTEKTPQALHASLERLQMDYVDLYLIHWPNPEKTRETWQAMETLQDQGLVRSIGLSNFRQSDIEQVLAFARYKPVYNQLEIHPYFQQKELVAYCEANDILVSCWSPLGTGSWSGVTAMEKPISDVRIKMLADKYGVSPAQVILKWDMQKGKIIIPKSETLENIQNNLQLDTFELSQEDINMIDGLDKGLRFGANPDTALYDNVDVIVPA